MTLIRLKLKYLAPMLGFCALACLPSLAACGAGQIFGPGSVIPADLQADANCVATQLIGGDVNPITIASACAIPENTTLTDLVSWLVKSLGAKGKLTPSQVTTASQALSQYLAAHAAR